VLSSPPYGGTYDYVHHHVRRYPWLGIDPTQMERNELGARRDLSQSRMRGQDPADLWDAQVVAMLKGMRKVVRPGSHIVLLVGDGQLGDERVAADRQLEGLAPRARLEVVAVASQQRPDWTGNGTRREHLVQLAVSRGDADDSDD